MKHLVQDGTAGPSAIRLTTGPEPTRRTGETLVDVAFVAPAFPDLLMSEGRYQFQPPPPYIPGSDFSGIVRETDQDSGLAVGQRVAGFVEIGAAAEVVVAPNDRLFPLPDDISLESGAAFPLNYLTAHFALVDRASVTPGESVVVTGASGGVGLATLQVARCLGARTVGIVSSEDKTDVVRAAGAVAVVGIDDLPRKVRAATDGGADIVLDVVGDDVTDLLRSLAPRGRLVVVGFASGTIPTVKLNRLLLNNIDIRGVEWGLVLDQRGAHVQWAEVMQLRAHGRLEPSISAVRPLSHFGSVLEDFRARATLGRTVLAAGDHT